ncbi:hypothetical protein [Occallatibacter savannae]|uniref:hypothetical protein n=1 Tax=Occallatibacter savannae TaxID=1002691 RepID=UPI000D68E1F1|nr:hypothetical protein [Occallatibacter savannae]
MNARRWLRPARTALFQVALGGLSAFAQPGHNLQIVASHVLKAAGATLQVDFAAGALDLSQDSVLAHVQRAADAVAAYYGRFPVSRDRILIVPDADGHGIGHGTTWGDMAGYPAMTRIHIGQHATEQDLKEDWMMTHELVHTGFPSLPDDQHWMEEGLATYVEPLARVMTGELTAKQVWHDMVRDMHQGEPQTGDAGIDHTHTWGRTYWGGALFCLVADVAIRRETHNRKGLRDALRAIVEHGGSIDQNWDLPKALAIGDTATGTHVLSEQYAKWKDAPVTVDLPRLWSELGVKPNGDEIEFVKDAPLAQVREAIAH